MNYDAMSKAYDECVYECRREDFFDSTIGDVLKISIGIGIGYILFKEAK